MSFKFTSQKLLNGLFEPEGIYLTPPCEGVLTVLQAWGDHADYYGEWRYNGVPVKGHTGIDFRVSPGAKLLAADAGHVTEISVERGGFERYMKIEHRWGESFYANIGEALVEAGQTVARGEAIGSAISNVISNVIGSAEHGAEHGAEHSAPAAVFLHFAVRIHPFNRYDGWGGFSDPLPYLPPASVILPDEAGEDQRSASRSPRRAALRTDQAEPLHPMAEDRPGLRRP